MSFWRSSLSISKSRSHSRIQNGNCQNIRHFSATASHRLMNLTGLTENQLVVREAIRKLCEDFPDVSTAFYFSIKVSSREQAYWREMESKETYPYAFYKAISQNGWIGIALPEELGGAGMGISEATMMMHTISESAHPPLTTQSTHAK
jgi:acyl-CoA dehydrogenase